MSDQTPWGPPRGPRGQRPQWRGPERRRHGPIEPLPSLVHIARRRERALLVAFAIGMLVLFAVAVTLASFD